jgi:DNA helicase-4
LFLKIFEEFYNCFEKLAKEEGKFDFNDLIIEAIDKYDGGNFRLYDYIIVDEFQDTSNLAMKLLDKIFEANPDATLLSVGDDWQSIYGFNGSDVTILSNYFNRYSGVSVCYLNSNFRSHSRIVNLGKQFISKNPAQVKKNVLSKNRNFQDSEIDFLSLEQMENKIRNIPDKESIFVLYRYNDDCLTLLKNFGDFFVLDKNRKPTKRANCTKNISMMTIHASKGLEAQHVFLLFSDGIRRKFPSEIEDHFVFNMLKTYSDDFPFSEERRLLYVAITRAEQNLYFVSPNKDPNSVFWDELKELVRSEQLAL